MMRNASIAAGLALCAMAACWGVAAKDAGPGTAAQRPPAGKDAGVPGAVTEVNGLGVRIFAQRLGQDPDGNTIVSPLSLAMALQMAANGAGGETEKAFRKGLALDDAPMNQISRNLGELAQRLAKQDKNLTLTIANGIWLAPEAKTLRSYTEAQRATFRARVERRDLGKPETLEAINKWFAERTQNLIPKMLTELPPDTRVVLANALYFKGRWQAVFDVAQTAPGPFRVAGREASDLPLMHQSGRFFYRETDTHQAIRLPFSGGEFEMVIALPREGTQAAALIKGFDDKGWADLLESKTYSERPGELALPRLELSTGGNLRPTLETIGFAEAFGESADFSRLARSRIRLDQAIHRVALKWNEEGAEAAAATAVVGVRSAAAPVIEPFRMIVDRPFCLALRHAPTGALILLGIVNDPRERVS